MILFVMAPAAKEPYISPNKPYICSKEPYISQKETYKPVPHSNSLVWHVQTYRETERQTDRHRHMGCLRLVDSLTLQVSFAKEPYEKRLHSAKETYEFKEPTNRSHPIGHTQTHTDIHRYTQIHTDTHRYTQVHTHHFKKSPTDIFKQTDRLTHTHIYADTKRRM